MKKIIFLSMALVAVFVARAQDYKDVLKKTVDAFNATDDMSQKVEYTNKLGLIAKKYDNEWAPHYYLAFAKTILSYNEKDETKRDAYLDDADKELEDAVNISKANSETYAMAAMIANARLAVNPMNRWQKYGKIFDEDLDKAKEMNADNPRIYFLQGNSKYHTPKAFGGGKKAALPYFEKANTLFEKETDADITKPYWGKVITAKLLAECKGDE
jgi:hypothetical protein